MFLTRRVFSLATATILSAAALSAAGMHAAQAQTDVKFTLDWKFEGPAAPYFVAIDDGYFSEQDLSVEISAGQGSLDAIPKVATGAFPVGFAGTFHRELTGAQNVRFIARIYGVDTEALLDFVGDFAELGGHYHMPVRSYSSGMRSRLAFGISMGIKFDTYLVDEVTSVGDASFRAKSAMVFKDRMATSSALVVTHSIAEIRNLCDYGAVLEEGELTFYEDLEEAIAVHGQNMKKARK